MKAMGLSGTVPEGGGMGTESRFRCGYLSEPCPYQEFRPPQETLVFRLMAGTTTSPYALPQ